MVSYIPKVNIMGLEKCYSILIPIIRSGCFVLNKQILEPSLLFEVRSSKLRQQPNEICFPGGRIETDESPLDAAIRETCEELLISNNSIQILTPTDLIVTPANKVLHPYIAILDSYQGTFSTDEVAETFLVPLSFFLHTEPTVYFNDVSIHPIEPFPVGKIPNGTRYRWEGGQYPVPFYFYKHRVIWGITARIIRAMLPRLEDISNELY